MSFSVLFVFQRRGGLRLSFVVHRENFIGDRCLLQAARLVSVYPSYIAKVYFRGLISVFRFLLTISFHRRKLVDSPVSHKVLKTSLALRKSISLLQLWSYTK